jgi:hypothetical protein
MGRRLAMFCDVAENLILLSGRADDGQAVLVFDRLPLLVHFPQLFLSRWRLVRWLAVAGRWGCKIRPRDDFERGSSLRAMHAVSLGHLEGHPFWLGLEPGRKFALPLGLLLWYHGL